MNMEKLKKAGINYEEGVKRFSGAEDLYKKFLKKFLEDNTFSDLKAAMEKKDYDTAFSCAHTLKGVSGNLSFVELFHDVGKLTEALRHKELTHVDTFYDDTEKSYEKIIDVLDGQI